MRRSKLPNSGMEPCIQAAQQRWMRRRGLRKKQPGELPQRCALLINSGPVQVLPSVADSPARSSIDTSPNLGRHIRQFTLLPSFYLLSHRLEVSLHSINSNRDAVDGRERFRVFREHKSKHAGDNVFRFGPADIRFPRIRLPAHVDRALAMSRHPHRGTEPYCVYFLTRLDRRLAPASRALTRNPQQLDPANSRGCNCFGGECRQRRAHRRFRLSPRKNSHRNECLDVSRT